MPKLILGSIDRVMARELPPGEIYEDSDGDLMLRTVGGAVSLAEKDGEEVFGQFDEDSPVLKLKVAKRYGKLKIE